MHSVAEVSTMLPIRIGLCTDQNLSYATTVERWRLFEAMGFDSIWLCDHYIQPSRPTGPYFEGWTLLAALAARTSRVRIGVLVSSNTFRHPALLAKEALTVDHISNGRLDVGIGAGWYVPEHVAYGLDFPGPAELVGRFHEAVDIVDRLLRQEITTYSGRYYHLIEAPMRPPPLQHPRPPFTLGAHGPKMLQVVAQFAETWNSFGTVDQMRERGAILDEACQKRGRDPATLRHSLYGWASMMPADPWASVAAFEDMVGSYGEVGVSEFIIDAPGPNQFATMERVAGELLPRLRGGRS
jgi:alkanesulfonate monooxygenase SsuD/methylene tetrahydromethanopterin reductase-like flavin-dependent oxidoreductase (luciferase family)